MPGAAGMPARVDRPAADRPRLGRPQTPRRDRRAEILATTLAPPPQHLGITHWSTATPPRPATTKGTFPNAGPGDVRVPPSTPTVDRDLAGVGPASKAGRPPLMIRCCEHNRRSD